MGEFLIREIEDGEEAGVIDLWHRCELTRPWNIPEIDLAFARDKANSQVLVGVRDGEIVASCMVGHDGHRGSVYYVAVEPDAQGAGLGRAIMEAAENWLLDKGVWKVNLMVRAGNEAVVEFYDRLGYGGDPVIVKSKVIDASKRGNPGTTK